MLEPLVLGTQPLRLFFELEESLLLFAPRQRFARLLVPRIFRRRHELGRLRALMLAESYWLWKAFVVPTRSNE